MCKKKIGKCNSTGRKLFVTLPVIFRWKRMSYYGLCYMSLFIFLVMLVSKIAITSKLLFVV